MMQFDVEARRSAVVLDEPEPADYLVLGDFGGRALTETPLLIDRDNFDETLAQFDLNLSGADFRSLEDYHPDRLYKQLEWFNEFREKEPASQPAPREAATPKADIAELLKTSSLLEQIAGGDPMENYVRELGRAHAAAPEKTRDAAQLAKLAETMRAVLHHPRFQTIEAAWRGLDFALRQLDGEQERMARIRIAHFPKAMAMEDVNDAESLRETHMRELLASRNWRAVFGLYTFGGGPDHIEFLGRMALLAASANAPFIAEASPDMGPHWDELRAIPEAAFIGLALPRFLLRLPYGEHTSAIESFPFEEMPGAPVHGQYLWGNPALACLAVIAKGELDLENLPLHTYQRDGEWKVTPCAETWMSEAEASALMDLGLMPLVSFKDSGRVRLAGLRAINGKALRLG